MKETIAAYGHLDYAHNNAGIEGILASTVDCTEDCWDPTIDINLKGVWLCMKYEIPEMLKNGGGAIVNTASVGGLVGLANLPAYAASKHGIVGLTKCAALERAAHLRGELELAIARLRPPGPRPGPGSTVAAGPGCTSSSCTRPTSRVGPTNRSCSAIPSAKAPFTAPAGAQSTRLDERLRRPAVRL